MILDLAIIGGDFIDQDLCLPKNKQYLNHYFKTDLAQLFVRYYLVAGSIKYFVDHTGIYCQRRNLELLRVKINKLESTLKKARKDFDFEVVAEIESGNFKC